jgi:hypothetical protein
MNKIKKFIGIKTVADVEIETDIGYVPIKNVMKTIKYKIWKVEFSDGSILECADNHILIDEEDNEIFCKELIVGSNIKSRDKILKVISVTETSNEENMYDIQMAYHHKFFTNEVLSHNTTVCVAYIVYQTIFNKEYCTAVLANKGATSREILSRAKMMYEELPWFLQMGVIEWNKGSVVFGNKSSIISAASSSSSIRGKAINCVSTDTFITIKNKKTGKIENITIGELENRLGSS